MKRRTYLKSILAATSLGAVPLCAEPAKHPIRLDVDLSVDPSREQEMLDNFHKIFKPAAVKFPGYIDVKMLKLRSALTSSSCASRPTTFRSARRVGRRTAPGFSTRRSRWTTSSRSPLGRASGRRSRRRTPRASVRPPRPGAATPDTCGRSAAPDRSAMLRCSPMTHLHRGNRPLAGCLNQP